jgi:hypothetical protein
MSEYVYRDSECMVDLEGEPIRLYVPKDEIDDYDEISRRAYESGRRFRMALQQEGII